MLDPIERSINSYKVTHRRIDKNGDNGDLQKFLVDNALSENDYCVIGAYTSRISDIINGKIRSGDKLSDIELKYKAQLISALKKAPSLNSVIVYRDENHQDDTVEKFLKGKQVGEVMNIPFFMFTYIDNERNPKNGLKIEIQTKELNSSAKDISLIGKSSEQEALIMCDTAFEIMEVDVVRNFIKLKEI